MTPKRQRPFLVRLGLIVSFTGPCGAVSDSVGRASAAASSARSVWRAAVAEAPARVRGAASRPWLSTAANSRFSASGWRGVREVAGFAFALGLGSTRIVSASRAGKTAWPLRRAHQGLLPLDFGAKLGVLPLAVLFLSAFSASLIASASLSSPYPPSPTARPPGSAGRKLPRRRLRAPHPTASSSCGGLRSASAVRWPLTSWALRPALVIAEGAALCCAAPPEFLLHRF